MAREYKIKPVKSLKILGIYLRDDMKLDTQVGRLSAELHNKIFQLRKLTKFTNFNTRNIFVKSYIIGKIIYALPLYMNINNTNLNKLHKVIMTAARMSIGNYCFKKSKKYIINKCGILDIKDLIIYSTLTFFYNINRRAQPQAILDLYTKQNSRDKIRKYRPLYIPESKFMEYSCIYRGAKLFNGIPQSYKQLSVERFKTTIKGYIAERVLWDSMD